MTLNMSTLILLLEMHSYDILLQLYLASLAIRLNNKEDLKQQRGPASNLALCTSK